MKKYNILYLTTNKITCKSYIGSHETNNLQDGYLGSGQYIINSIKKYGKENFNIKILKNFSNIEEARKSEEKFIKEYNTLYPNGYNILETGGMGPYGGTHSEHTRQKLSKAHKGKKRIFSDEHKIKLAKAAREWHENIGMSEETREKISERRKGIFISEGSRENYKKGNKDKNLGKKHQKVECEYCHKKISKANYIRWHGEKCKAYE